MQTTQSHRKRVRKLALAGAAVLLAGGAIVSASYAGAAEDADAAAAAQQASCDDEEEECEESSNEDSNEDSDEESSNEDSSNENSSNDDSSGEGEESAAPGEVPAGVPGTVTGFPANAKFDYQINDPYDPPSEVKVVSRDFTEKPAAVDYNICYINGFQSQPDGKDESGGPAEGTSAWFTADPQHAKLLLKNPTPATPTRNGDKYATKYYVDPGWEGEIMFDISKPENLAPLAEIVGKQIQTCAESRFNAVEIDNMDTFTRALKNESDRREAAQADGDFDSSGRPLIFNADQALTYAGLLIQKAHAAGLAVAQKNTAEFKGAGKAKGFDFAVVESCGETGECQDYENVYGDQWVDIEYDDAAFTAACGAVKEKISVVRRDLAVNAPGGEGYVYDEC